MIQPAIFQVAQRGFAFRTLQQMLGEKCRSLPMHFHQRAALLIFAALFRRTFARLRNRDTAFFRYGAHRFGERRFFQFHHKLKNVAAFAAAEAVIHLLHRANAERRSFFLVERAQTAEILPTFF